MVVPGTFLGEAGAPDRPAVNTHTFRDACSRFSTGITIATAASAESSPVGVTISSFTSVSLVPPLVCICLNERSRVLPHVLHSGAFGISVLGEDQQDIADIFASPVPDRFHGVPWFVGDLGVPFIGGALVYMACSVVNSVAAGDHCIVIGLVQHAEHLEGKPLIRFKSSYHGLHVNGRHKAAGM